MAEKEKLNLDEIEELLNERSGLLGVSGRSHDMRDLLKAADKEPRAALAVELFCYRVRKYIGSYLAVLGGANAVLFGGGIGENAGRVRARILQNMGWFGLDLDQARNDSTAGIEGPISSESSRIQAYVVPVDESMLIARQAAEIIPGKL
jgi:acetate kinase